MVCDSFYYCWLDLLIFCWGFLYLYSLNILACNFLFLQYLSGFDIRVMVASEWFWKFSILIYLLEKFEKVTLVEFPCEAISFWTFVCWEFHCFILFVWFWWVFFFVCFYKFKSLIVIYLFRLSISSWFSLGRLYVSRLLSISSRLSNLLSYNYSYYF